MLFKNILCNKKFLVTVFLLGIFYYAIFYENIASTDLLILLFLVLCPLMHMFMHNGHHIKHKNNSKEENENE